MAEDLSETDKEYLSTITSSIKRARALLMSISLIAAWLLASQILNLIQWQNVRTPASYNIGDAADSVLRGCSLRVPVSVVRACDKFEYLPSGAPQVDSVVMAADTKLAGVKIDVLFSDLRPSDKVAYCKKLQKNPDNDELISISYPTEKPLLEKVSWCQHYREFILDQCSDSNLIACAQTIVNCTKRLENLVILRYPQQKSFEQKIDWCRHYYPYILAQWERRRTPDSLEYIAIVRVLLDRGSISKTKLPKDIIERPIVDVPVVGLSVNLDDINIVGAIILMFAMVWFRFALRQVKENTEWVRDRFSGRYKRTAFFEKWLAMQFLFIQKPHRESGIKPSVKSQPTVYSLFFVPYIVVFSSWLVSFHDISWQIAAYSAITRVVGTPHIDAYHSVLGEVTGIVVLRWGILLGTAVFLAREALKSWRTMHDINEGLISPRPDRTDTERKGDRKRQTLTFIVISAIPILVMLVWTFVRIGSIKQSIKLYGWNYGTDFVGSLTILLTIIALLAVLYYIVWPKLVLKS